MHKDATLGLKKNRFYYDYCKKSIAFTLFSPPYLPYMRGLFASYTLYVGGKCPCQYPSLKICHFLRFR